ncbi:MAG: heme-dependent oxidative N-demethylase subunit alpha family protein, partial [Tateyamaria sp.]|uniref:heme-dependent oxidative N-demethylase subunit alpha family protein n=1 Tax=Tateyamaria sp. TaxID=1929288 RepID=UPI00329EC507
MGKIDWLTIDAAYAAQLAEKSKLIKDQGADVLTCLPEAESAAQETLEDVLTLLRARPDFEVGDGWATRPD